MFLSSCLSFSSAKTKHTHTHTLAELSPHKGQYHVSLRPLEPATPRPIFMLVFYFIASPRHDTRARSFTCLLIARVGAMQASETCKGVALSRLMGADDKAGPECVFFFYFVRRELKRHAAYKVGIKFRARAFRFKIRSFLSCAPNELPHLRARN